MSTISRGTKLGPYEVIDLVGRGGMGEVYRAHDTRLGRTVAIKTLSPDIARDNEFKQRFEREARALAALSHPHICPVFDVGSHEGTEYLVMEFLEGETLADRLQRGPLPLREALARATEVADALDKAHRRGIVHRDLKPGNVMLTTGGAARTGAPQAKLLDFGLAKLGPNRAPGYGLGAPEALGASVVDTVVTSQGAPSGLRETTTTSPLTGRGTVLGTVQYMAPEQLEGKAVDARTDIFAFGALLYEMLTGRRAFEGQSTASIMAAILERQPTPLGELQPLTPSALDRLVRRCLAKDPDERWQHAGDLLAELRWIAESSGTVSGAGAAAAIAGRETVGTSSRQVSVGVAGVAALGAAILAGSAAWTTRPPAAMTGAPARFPMHATINPGPGVRLSDYNQPGSNVQISADGKRIIFVGFSGARTMLFRHELETGTTSPIEGTDGARGPFLSPDGLWVAFQSETLLSSATGRLTRASVFGGQVSAILAAPGERAGAWLAGDRFLLSANPSAGDLSSATPTAQPLRNLALGATAEEFPKANLSETESHLFPHALPDGSAVVVTAREGRPTSPAWSVKRVGADGSAELLVANAYFGMPTVSGHLLYTTGLGRLVAQRLDAGSRTAIGQPVVVVEGIRTSTSAGTAQYGVSASGTLVYVGGSADRSSRTPVWVTRSGAETTLSAEGR
jgi:tRNA A-37 threonylcarbamoyl transferase component Bud32